MTQVIIDLLRRMSLDVIYKAPNNNPNYYYRNLSLEERTSRPKQNYQCGDMALWFMEECEKLNIKNVKYLFVYHEPIVYKSTGLFNNQVYLDLIKRSHSEAYVESLFKTIPRYSVIRHTHALVEMLIDKEMFVVDPLNCLLYCVGKEALCRGQGIKESLFFKEQIDWLLDFWSHKHLITMLYVSEFFWKSVYHISHEINGDLP